MYGILIDGKPEPYVRADTLEWARHLLKSNRTSHRADLALLVDCAGCDEETWIGCDDDGELLASPGLCGFCYFDPERIDL